MTPINKPKEKNEEARWAGILFLCFLPAIK
jgi:hypothetical protein